MRYLPLTASEREQILKLCGVKDFEELTSEIPEELRVKGLLDLEAPLSESELLKHIHKLAKKNTASEMTSFLGQGIYDHGWPSVIDQITNRGEFLTAYTPYQPEVSQGTLQMIFEYQSMIANLMGMQVSNASLYDGPTAIVEGILMAARLQNLKSGRVLISEGTYARAVQLIESYLKPLGFEIEIWKANPKTFLCETGKLNHDPEHPVIGVVLQSPNRWGLVEDWQELQSAALKLKTKSIASVTHAHSLAIFSPPGEHSIDIAVGEGQALGIPVGFGGPHLGIFCCKKTDVRQMPGRLVGQTSDSHGQRAFCVTLATREQHIRREKATSNICSNQNFMVVRACMYLTLMGPQGMRTAAENARGKAYYARKRLQEALLKSAPDVAMLDGEIFNEVALLVPPKRKLWLETLIQRAEKQKILAGLTVEVPGDSGFVTAQVLAFTELHTVAEIDALVNAVAQGGEAS